MCQMSIVTGLLLFLLLQLLSCTIAQQTQGELVTVVVIYRHGDRTPVDPYPTDPYQNSSFWPVGFGQLTNLGKEQHFQLGQWLRKRYADFLPEKYSEDDIRVRSTDVDRSLMSAYANLAGLYPPDNQQQWNPAIKWQPIPVHTAPETEDAVLAMKRPCPKYKLLYKKLLDSPEFVRIQKDNQELYDYVTKFSGRSVQDVEHLEFIYNTLFIENLYNYTLPEWTKTVFPDRMRPVARLSFATDCYTEDMARLKTGPFFNELTDDLLGASKKMHMYSGHDTTIANILNTMGVFEWHSPPYASTILFELRSSNAAKYVNVYYRNTTDAPRLLQLPHCEVDCPLDDFVALLSKFSLDHDKWLEACRISIFDLMPFTSVQDALIVGGIGVLLMLMVTAVAGIFCARPKKEQRSYLRLPDSDETA